jgi:hypothetical protein
MKKTTILLCIAIVLSAGAMAQTADVKNDEKALKSSVKDKKEDRHEAGKDLTHLKVKSAIKERKEVRSHRKSIHKQGEHLEAHGVKHPISKAKHQVKAEKEAKKGKE